MSPAAPGGTSYRGPTIVTPVAPRALLATFVVGVVVAFAVNLAIRWFGQHVLDAAKHLTPTQLIPPTVLPVLGNCFGSFMSWRMPSSKSLRSFLGVGGFMTLVGVAISRAMVPSSAGAGDLAVAVAVSVASLLVIIPALLYPVRHQAEVRRPPPWGREEPTV
ncbi:MAG: hypothetical protein ACR2KV_02325 [Solirubrobacteraceae bacterium]